MTAKLDLEITIESLFDDLNACNNEQEKIILKNKLMVIRNYSNSQYEKNSDDKINTHIDKNKHYAIIDSIILRLQSEFIGENLSDISHSIKVFFEKNSEKLTWRVLLNNELSELPPSIYAEFNITNKDIPQYSENIFLDSEKDKEEYRKGAKKLKDSSEQLKKIFSKNKLSNILLSVNMYNEEESRKKLHAIFLKDFKIAIEHLEKTRGHLEKPDFPNRGIYSTSDILRTVNDLIIKFNKIEQSLVVGDEISEILIETYMGNSSQEQLNILGINVDSSKGMTISTPQNKKAGRPEKLEKNLAKEIYKKYINPGLKNPIYFNDKHLGRIALVLKDLFPEKDFPTNSTGIIYKAVYELKKEKDS